MIGLPCDIPNHASYLQSWIAVLKQDRREIFHAAAEAQRMAYYILGFHPDYAETPVEFSDAEDDGATSTAPAPRLEKGEAMPSESIRLNWLPGFKGRLGHVFPHEAELEEKRAEMADLEASLAATPDGGDSR